MKFVRHLSSPFVRGAGWICKRFSRCLLLRPFRQNNGGWLQSVSISEASLCWAGESTWVEGAGSGSFHHDTPMHLSQQDPPAEKRRHGAPLAADINGLSDALSDRDGRDPVARVVSVDVDELLHELALHLPRDLSPVRRRHRDRAMALLCEEAVLETAYCASIVYLEGVVEGSSLRAGGLIMSAPVKLPKKGEVTALGCVACTLGPQLESRVRQLFADKRAPLALALEALGNELLQLLGRRMLAELLQTVRRQGLILGQRLQFGEQESGRQAPVALLRLAGAEATGIRLSESHPLWPHKSATAVFAVGRNLSKLSLSRHDV